MPTSKTNNSRAMQAPETAAKSSQPATKSSSKSTSADSKQTVSSKQKGSNNLDDLAREAEQTTRTRKPGSQSNSSKQGNNGRGGGK